MQGVNNCLIFDMSNKPKDNDMTTQETNTFAATVGAFKIAIDRAFEQGLSPEQFTQMMMTEKEKFLSLVDSCKKELESK